MREILTELSDKVPHFTFLVVGQLAVLCAQVFLLRVARRRRRACLDLEDKIEREGWAAVAQTEIPSWWPALLAGMSALVIPALGLWSFATARDGFRTAMTNESLGEKVAQVFDSLSGMLNAIPLTGGLFLASAFMAMVSGTVILVARARTFRLVAVAPRPVPDGAAVSPSSVRGPGSDNLTVLPVLLFVGVLLPVIVGTWLYAIVMIQGMSALGHVPLTARVPHLVATLDRAHGILVGRAWLRWPGAIAATSVGGALLVVWGRRWRWRPGWPWTLLISQACVVGAACLFIAAAPFRAENHMPWPPPAGTERLLVDEPRSPALEGPDEIERAPILWLNEQQHSLDGYRANAEDIETLLRAHKQNYRMLNPTADWAGTLLVISVADLPIPTLMAYLEGAARADYHDALFVFTKRETLVRPILGKLSRVTATGVAVTLVDHDADDNAVVDPRTFRTYGDLAHRLVELRTAGHAVALRTD